MLRFEDYKIYLKHLFQKSIFSSKKKSQAEWKEPNVVEKNNALSMLQASCLAEAFANSFNPERGLEHWQLVSNTIFYKAVSSKEYSNSTFAMGSYSLSEHPGFSVHWVNHIELALSHLGSIFLPKSDLT